MDITSIIQVKWYLFFVAKLSHILNNYVNRLKKSLNDRIFRYKFKQ